ncbi:MAG TPA: ABC transporter permease subunit [Solirubrobacteraceae bacterium]|jgi:phosphate transport system permease protein|nr:ABC transporter permease subunit [Solirubrobacteraceae bacterium]
MAGSVALPPPQAGAPRRRHGRRSSVRSWRVRDQVVWLLAWLAGALLCLVAGAIVVFLAVKGLAYLRPSLLVTSPSPSADQAGSGGFLDPMIGTLTMAVIGTVLATPLAVASAFWVVEYGRPRRLAALVETAIEIVAATPDIVLAIFGLALFQFGIFAPLSFTASGGGVYGRSFFAAGIMMSLIALPLTYAATRNGLRAAPRQLREASYALGKTRIATIRRVLLPKVRSDIATGAVLGLGRIIGSTAIVVLLLGDSLQNNPTGSVPLLGFLRGTGSTLTSYIFENSPAGDGNAPQKAYAAAFVLILIVLILNAAVARFSRRGADVAMAAGRLSL